MDAPIRQRTDEEIAADVELAASSLEKAIEVSLRYGTDRMHFLEFCLVAWDENTQHVK